MPLAGRLAARRPRARLLQPEFRVRLRPIESPRARSLTTDRNPTDDRVWLGSKRPGWYWTLSVQSTRPIFSWCTATPTSPTGPMPGRRNRRQPRPRDGSAMAGRSGREVDRPPTLRRHPGRGGGLSLAMVDGKRQLELGWALLRTAGRQGFATEIGRAGLDYAFGVLGHNEVVSFTEVHNRTSPAVMERLGMTFVKIIYERGVIEGCDGIHAAAPFALYRLRRDDAAPPPAAGSPASGRSSRRAPRRSETGSE